MPTPSEGRALLFLAAVAALGLGVRGWRAVQGPDPPASDREALARQIATVDSAVNAGGRRRAQGPRPSRVASDAAPDVDARERPRARVEEPVEPVDLDRASAVELDALPGIGPALAARIVADRDAHGPFGSLEALQEVKGIGPALAAKLSSRVTFSAPPRPPRPKATARDSPHP